MRDYIDMTGRTEEEAIEKALEQLGLDRDEVSVEILERAKSGFLGIGRTDAKVRISYGEDRPESPKAASLEPDSPRQEIKSDTAAEAPSGAERRNAGKTDRGGRKKSKEADSAKEARKNANVGGNAQKAPEQKSEKSDVPKAADRKSGRGGKSDMPKAADRKAEKGGKSDTPKTAERKSAKQNAVNMEQSEEGKTAAGGKTVSGGDSRENPPAAAQKTSPSSVSAPLPDHEADDEKAAAIRTFLGGLLEHMDQQAAVRVYLAEEGRYKVILEGQGMGGLIGRRGETLDAIQQLTNYAVNRSGNRVRIQLDAEGYREKREQSLQNLARKEAAKVVKFRRSRTLEPMNAYERHVIHTALQDFRGVNTYSTGVDPNRRVVVAYDREKL